MLAARPLRFGFNSARLTAESESLLREIADALNRRPETRLLIAGHADGTGAKGYNQRLSARRAEAAARWLVSAGIDPARLQTRGYGETRPRADNLTRKGRALNRRVEFIREE
jgi:OOP family OmpA-OmpF porin